MANRMKEEEKNEKIIRGLIKLPANKRCINCNSLGPQYVCITFWTFICTNCSGLHREFTHRVKSISMAKFTSQEVNALQGGGNERAREMYFKEWDPQRHSYPDSSHLDRLRDFIKHVYVERRYSGGKNIDELPRVKGERDDYDGNRSSKTDRSGSRSPPYNDPYEKHFGERPSSAMSDDRNSHFNYEARSPSYDQGDHKSPMRDEIPRDDKAGNDVQSPKSYKGRTSEELPKPGVSDHQKSVYISSPPIVRPVRDILGVDIPPLRVGELPKMNGGKTSNRLSETQSSTSSKGPNDENLVELKRVHSGSLIDFSADSEPPTFDAVKEFVPQQTGSAPANDGGWASFDISSQQKAPKSASTAGDLESVFAQLFVNLPTPVVAPTFPPAASTNSLSISNNSGQWPAMQPQPSSYQVSNHSTNSPVHAPVSAQLVGPSFPSSVQGAMAVLDGQSSHPVMHLSHQRSVFGNSQNSLEVEAGGRKELPADLFTGVYSTSSASYPAWRMGPHHGMVYRMQYPVMMAATYGTAMQSSPTFHTSVSTNPFDLGNESASAPNPVINPSASLQAVSPRNLFSSTNSSNFTAVPPQWTPQQQFPYPSSAFPGPHMMQQFRHDMPRLPSTNFFPAVNQGVGSEAIPYGASNSSQLPARANSSVPSAGGNPFG